MKDIIAAYCVRLGISVPSLVRDSKLECKAYYDPTTCTIYTRTFNRMVVLHELGHHIQHVLQDKHPAGVKYPKAIGQKCHELVAQGMVWEVAEFEAFAILFAEMPDSTAYAIRKARYRHAA